MSKTARSLKLGVQLLTLCVLNPAARLDAEPTPIFETTELFRAGDEGYHTYRIPSLAITPKGTLLAAVAARFDGPGDWANADTMIRRSTDRGRTWEKRRIVTDDGANVVDNATFIVDPRSSIVYLMYQINYARAYLKTSDDDGETWSTPREITNVFEEFRDRDGFPWEVIAMGPGHGIVTERGRFVVPVWLSTDHSHRPSISATIYSDDRGATWHAGAVIVKSTSATPNPSEHVLSQLSDGRILANVRNESTNHRRLVCSSDDGASKWSEPVFHEELFDPICMASMTTHDIVGDGEEPRLLFCNPNSYRASVDRTTRDARQRRNLTIRMSEDDGRTWPVQRVIDAGAAGYSDIAVDDEGTVFVLYEKGGFDKENETRIGQITLAKLNLAWLTAADK